MAVDDLPEVVWEQYTQFLGPLADQALNPAQKGIEQNAGEKKICQQVKTAKYKALYEQAFGEPIDCRSSAYNTSFKRIAVAVAAYEASDEVSPFNSKRDIALYKELACLNGQAFEGYEFDRDYCALEESVNWGRFPLAGLTDQENQGHDLFYAVTSDLNPTGKDAGCRFCHNDNPTPFSFRGPQVPGTNLDGTEPRQLYTDNAYHNIGIPYNREIPDTPKGSVVGVSGHLTSASPGFFRDPSIRNVGLGEGEDFVKAYGHNGYFKSLWQIVHFYSTRDLKTRCEELPEPILDATVQEALDNDCWPEPEFSNPGNFGLVGIADLTTEQEEAIVAYLKTLSDTTVAEAP